MEPTIGVVSLVCDADEIAPVGHSGARAFAPAAAG